MASQIPPSSVSFRFEWNGPTAAANGQWVSVVGFALMPQPGVLKNPGVFVSIPKGLQSKKCLQLPFQHDTNGAPAKPKFGVWTMTPECAKVLIVGVRLYQLVESSSAPSDQGSKAKQSRVTSGERPVPLEFTADLVAGENYRIVLTSDSSLNLTAAIVKNPAVEQPKQSASRLPLQSARFPSAAEMLSDELLYMNYLVGFLKPKMRECELLAKMSLSERIRQGAIIWCDSFDPAQSLRSELNKWPESHLKMVGKKLRSLGSRVQMAVQQEREVVLRELAVEGLKLCCLSLLTAETLKNMMLTQLQALIKINENLENRKEALAQVTGLQQKISKTFADQVMTEIDKLSLPQQEDRNKKSADMET